MITRIEVDFALPVELTDEEMQSLGRFIQRIAKRHQPEGWVHWCSGCGNKPNWSQADAIFLGKEPDPNAPVSGEPTFDDSILHFETTAREAYQQEIARDKWRAALRKWYRLPWWKRMFTAKPVLKEASNEQV